MMKWLKNIFKREMKAPVETPVLSFLDCIAPGVLKFETDHYICGNTWRSVWALWEYPASTESQALLRRLQSLQQPSCKMKGVHIRI